MSRYHYAVSLSEGTLWSVIVSYRTKRECESHAIAFVKAGRLRKAITLRGLRTRPWQTIDTFRSAEYR